MYVIYICDIACFKGLYTVCTVKRWTPAACGSLFIVNEFANRSSGLWKH